MADITIPINIEVMHREAKRIIPIFELPSRANPIAFITNAGPAFTQNSIILLACAMVIWWLSNNSYVIFAPTGNPPIRLIKIAPAVQPGNLKSNRVNGSNKKPNLVQNPDLTRNDERTIKGNKEGIITPAQRYSPFVIPLETTAGKRSKQNPIITIRRTIGILIIFSLIAGRKVFISFFTIVMPLVRSLFCSCYHKYH